MAITLNQIAYNIRNIAYGGKNSEENNISLRQIKHWIHYHRAKLIADNIDKGILSYSNLYQQLEITTRNSTAEELKQLYLGWYLHVKDPSNYPVPTASVFSSLHPMNHGTGEQLTGSFLAYNNDFPVKLSDLNFTQKYNWDYDKYTTKDQYGREIANTQIKGDWRNIGNHGFIIPTPLMLRDNNGIKEINLYRKVHLPSDVNLPYEDLISRHHNGISLYHKTNSESNYGNYNKFTNNAKPYYELDKYISKTPEYTSMWHDIEANTDSSTLAHSGEDVLSAFFEEQNIDYSVIKFQGLQISPNYHGGYETPDGEEMYWAYNATAKMILEDPTQISIMYHQDNFGDSGPYVPAGDMLQHSVKHQWNDDKSLYPIPAEYVSDLIQRVIQSEMRTELSSMSDERTDGMDTTKLMKRGS